MCSYYNRSIFLFITWFCSTYTGLCQYIWTTSCCLSSKLQKYQNCPTVPNEKWKNICLIFTAIIKDTIINIQKLKLPLSTKQENTQVWWRITSNICVPMEVTDTCKKHHQLIFYGEFEGEKKSEWSWGRHFPLLLWNLRDVNNYLDISQWRQHSHEKNAPWIIKCQVRQKICDSWVHLL